MKQTDPLKIKVTALGPQAKVFAGDDSHPPLYERDVLALLPFQVHPGKHVIAVYVMTRDAVRSISPAKFRLEIIGAAGKKASFYDPHEDKKLTVEPGKSLAGEVVVTLDAVDHPRLLTIEK